MAAFALLLPVSCTPDTGPPAPAPEAPEPAPRPELLVDPDRPVILAFGDSLTNGHDVDRDMSYPAQLGRQLEELGYPHQVVNFGNDGDTTAQGLARLDGALALEPQIVVLEFGGNDGLQGRGLDAMRANLARMIEAFTGIGSHVVLAGISLPRNYGPDFIRTFENIYTELAAEYEVTLIPFFLEGLVDLEALDSGEATLGESVRFMQSDGTHPTAEGYTIVAETVLEAIEPLLAP